MNAFIFDLNGTMVHDMDYHTAAWQHIFNHELGGHFTWDEVKPQMYGKNQEVLERVFGPGRFSAEQVARLSQAKEHATRKRFGRTYGYCRAWPSFWRRPTRAAFGWPLARRRFRSTSTSCSMAWGYGRTSAPS